MSENDFAQTQGDQYQGSNYANFQGAGVDTQGNATQAVNENDTNNATQGETAKSSSTGTGTTASPTAASSGLTGPALPSMGKMATNAVVGAALPYAGQQIGAAAGAALGSGSSFGEALGKGVSSFGNTISGGLIGSPAPTAADGAFMSNFGDSASNGIGAVDSAAPSVGGSIGSGVGTFAADLISGQGFVKSAVAGVASAAGTYAGEAIGTAILPGIGTVIGGFIGGAIGGIFCFYPDTEIIMGDLSMKKVCDLKLGDDVLFGGAVIAAGQAYADGIYDYKNTKVSSGHAVLEDGKWIRVSDSSVARKTDADIAIVCPVITAKHILVTRWFVSADHIEVDIDDKSRITGADSLAIMNDDKIRISELLKLEKDHCIG